MIRDIFRLALPVVVSQFLVLLMQVVDLHFIGRYIPSGEASAALAGVGLVNSLQGFGLVLGIGLLSGLEYRIPHALGEGYREGARRYAVAGLWVALAWGCLVAAAARLVGAFFAEMGLPAASVEQAAKFLDPTALSLPFVFLFMVGRCFLQATGRAREVTYALVFANLTNGLFNWIALAQPFGLPSYGVAGSGWATFFSRFLLAILVLPRGISSVGIGGLSDLAPLRSALRGLLVLGVPVAGQMGMEVGFFSLSTFLAARIGSVEGAAHQIALQVASTTFMLPLGMSSAAALLIARALGEGDRSRAERVARMVLAYPALFMAGVGGLIFGLANPIARFFSADPAVLTITPVLFAVAAAFQVFDCTQVVAAGVFRGLGRTRAPFVGNLVGHWMIGLPVTLAFQHQLGLGLTGIWLGLSVGLAAVSAILIFGLRTVLFAKPLTATLDRPLP